MVAPLISSDAMPGQTQQARASPLPVRPPHFTGRGRPAAVPRGELRQREKSHIDPEQGAVSLLDVVRQARFFY